MGTAIGGLCEADDSVGQANAQLVVINAEQYQQALADLLAMPSPAEVTGLIERFGGKALFSGEDSEQRLAIAVEAFHRTAQHVAARMRAIECAELSAQACATAFISDFVEPLYRRPLIEHERAQYLEFFTQADDPARDGQHAAMVAALSSPHFLFRLESLDEQ